MRVTAQKISWHLLLLCTALFLVTAKPVNAQTVLNAGDIAIFFAQADTPDDFAFVTFVDIDPGTVIYFTDCGADNSGFNTPCGEGAFRYTAPAGGLNAGEVIRLTTSVSDFNVYNDSRIVSSFAISSAGDQFIAFQDASNAAGSNNAGNNPRFLFAVNLASTQFTGNKTDSNQTGLPFGLSATGLPRTALGLGSGTGTEDEWDNAIYSGSYNFSDVAAARLALTNPANYAFSNERTEVAYAAAVARIPDSIFGTLNTPPDVSSLPTAVNVVEDTAGDFMMSSATFEDAEDDPLVLTLTASSGTFTANDAGGVTVGGSGGSVLTLSGSVAAINSYLDTVSNIRYTGAQDVFGPDAATVQVNANDGSANPLLGQIDVTIAGVNDPPVFINLNGMPEFTEGGPAVRLDGDVSIADAELDMLNGGSGNYTGASVTIARSGGANPDDIFSVVPTGLIDVSGSLIRSGGNVVGSIDPSSAPGEISLFFVINGTIASTAIVNDTLRAIHYVNASGDPPSMVQLDWVFSDNNAGDAQGSGDNPGITSGSSTVSIVATNGPPEIAIGSGNTVGLTETDIGLTAGGTLTVTDADAADVVIASVSNVVAGGTTVGAPNNAALLGFLSIAPSPVLTAGQTSGTLNWNFNSATEAFDYLSGDESLVLTYTITATDNAMPALSDTEFVSITIAGSNDAPTVVVGSGNTANLDETDAGLTAGGTLTVTDVDISDAVTASVSTVVASGTTGGAPDNATLLAFLSVAPSPVLTAGQTSGTLNWNFDSASEAFDYLNAGESLILTYTVNSTDDATAPLAVSETVTITINGSNEAPVNTVPAAPVSVSDHSADPVTGLSIDDPDSASVISTVSVPDGGTFNAAGPAAISGADSSSIQRSGSVSDVNASLATLTFTAPLNTSGDITVTLLTDDGELNDSDDFIIRVVDNTAPVFDAITRQTPADEVTNADTLTFRATFDSNVQNVDATDFVVNGGSTATVTDVQVVTADTVFDVTIAGGDLTSFDGTVGLGLAAGQDITDEFGNVLPSAEPIANETYTLDNTAPVLESIQRQNPSAQNTNADTLTFRATFDSGVQNVDVTDFVVNGGSTATVTNIASVTASVFDLTASGGDLAGFEGTVRLDLASGQNIVDAAGNALPGAEPAIDETYTLDNTAPVFDSIARQNPADEATNADTLTFRATFDSDVQNIDATDFVVNGGSTATVTNVAPVTANVFELTVSGGDLGDFDGTVGLDLAPGQDITDAAGNALSSTEPAVDEAYTLDNTAPIATVDALTTNDTTPALSGTVDDAEASLALVVDGQTVNPTNNADGTWSLADDTLAALPFGSYDVQVSATDAVGNVGQDETLDELVITDDLDGDGVADGIEQAGPNNGDGNNDGIPDAGQGSVASLPTATGRGYMTLVLANAGCSQLEQVAAVDSAALPPDSPTVAYPFGLVGFSVSCETAIVDVIYPEASAPEFQTATYRKYGPVTPGDAGTIAWYDFSAFASLADTTWTLDLADNRLGDDTGDDGVIVDQGGPAINIEPLIVPVNQPWALALLMLMMLALGAYLHPTRR